MIGILAYGAYVPPTRLPLSVIAGRPAKPGDPEKAVAWHDEDAITLGVTAAIHCLSGVDRSDIDMLVFASTTLPFQEKQAASLVARALDLPCEIRTADQTGSTRAATTALRAAFDAVRAGSARRVLVIASDVRLAAPRSALEAKFGDGAAALLIGDGDAIAILDDAVSISDEVTDIWRPTGDPFVHTWEERFVVQQSFLPNMTFVIRSLLEESGTKLADYARFALAAPDARSLGELARASQIEKERLQTGFYGELGYPGSAFAPLLLIGALEEAAAGERILLANFGNGADAMAFRATERIARFEARRDVRWNLDRRRPVGRYEDYIEARGLGAREWEAGTHPGLSATILFRERDDDLSLLGQRCRACRAVQFPAQRVCETCFAKDDFEKVRLSDRIAEVVTYTFDYFFPTPDPPTIVTIVEVLGARLHLQVVELPPEEMAIGREIEFVFRRIHAAGGRPNYYWKGIPKPASR